MQKFSVKYAEARKVSCDGRKNLDMGRFEPWTPELEAECCRLFNEKWDPVKEKVEPRSPPIDASISKGTSCDEDLTERTADLSESEFDESADQESCVREQESCPVAAIPSTEAAKPAKRIAKTVKRTRTNPQECQSENSAIHNFLGNLFGDRLNNCNLIVDNAKMAPDRAIDFDALVKTRAQREKELKSRRQSRGGRRRHRVPTDNRFLATPPKPSPRRVRRPGRNHPVMMLLQDFQTTLNTCEKTGSSGAPKAPQRCESVDEDDAFWRDIKGTQKVAEQSTTAL
jgi:hypothetical protein